MTRVVLIRHGQTEWNNAGRYQGQSNTELSEAGCRQAEILADNFPVEKVDAIYSSDLNRALATAEAVAKKFNLEVIPEIDFRELDFGDWEGLTYPEINEKWPEEVANFFGAPEKLKIPNGETFPQVAERAVKRLKEIIADNEGKTVVVTAHGAVIRSMLATLMHIPLHYLWSIRQDNTAVNVLRFDGDYVMVEAINNTAHLGKFIAAGVVKGQSPTK
ncbi:MAG: histidine phosphatase family protein [Selenomonadaceae bacterium]|nr:histidine phosphatase family protein [Selenomonadaceae bacterium]